MMTLLIPVTAITYLSTLALPNGIAPKALTPFFKSFQRTSFVTLSKDYLIKIVPTTKYVSGTHIKAALWLSGVTECVYKEMLNSDSETQKCIGSASLRTGMQASLEAIYVLGGVKVAYASQMIYALSRAMSRVSLDLYYGNKLNLPDTGFSSIKDLLARLVESELVKIQGDPYGFFSGALIEGTLNTIAEYFKSQSIDEERKKQDAAFVEELLTVHREDNRNQTPSDTFLDQETQINSNNITTKDTEEYIETGEHNYAFTKIHALLHEIGCC